MPIKVFAKNYRGFKALEIDLDGVTFLVGDNSSGKSSLVQLVNYVVSSELESTPYLRDVLASDKHDFFSPYFDFADVTIGFISGNGPERVVKVLTMRRRKDLMIPDILSHTIISGSKRISFRASGDSKFVKTSLLEGELTVADVYRLHEEQTGFKLLKLKESTGVKYPLNSSPFLYEVYAQSAVERGFKEALINSAAVCIDRSTSHIGPLRGTPEPYYALERVYSAKGSHFAAMLHDIKKFRTSKYVDYVNKFGQESQLFEELNVEKMSRKIPHSPLVVSVKKRGRDFLISQVGVGISQVLPVLVDSLFRKVTGDNVIMLLQQPELHLHPVAQAALGEFIFRMADGQMWYFIETHSDYLMDRFRVNMREAEDVEPTRIIYCENKQDGNYATTILVDSDGTLKDPPENYREFQVNELMRTFF